MAVAPPAGRSSDRLAPQSTYTDLCMSSIEGTDNELTELARDMFAALQPRLANAPKRARKRRILATVLLPGSVTTP
jgi:hypothetical protein